MAHSAGRASTTTGMDRIIASRNIAISACRPVSPACSRFRAPMNCATSAIVPVVIASAPTIISIMNC